MSVAVGNGRGQSAFKKTPAPTVGRKYACSKPDRFVKTLPSVDSDRTLRGIDPRYIHRLPEHKYARSYTYTICSFSVGLLLFSVSSSYCYYLFNAGTSGVETYRRPESKIPFSLPSHRRSSKKQQAVNRNRNRMISMLIKICILVISRYY